MNYCSILIGYDQDLLRSPLVKSLGLYKLSSACADSIKPKAGWFSLYSRDFQSPSVSSTSGCSRFSRSDADGQ
ncbi:MAG: hypothetical protein V7K22_21035 [Nostoc sp.]|uniref:hypothetical protein n=1 Tax=Nostoc sp. TaxID=1180 RepID=UPI002FFB6665